MNKKLPVDKELLRQRLKLKHLEARRKIADKYPHADKFLKDRQLDLGKIREHSAKLISAGALSSALLLGSPTDIKLLPAPQEVLDKFSRDNAKSERSKKILVDTFKSILPSRPRPLTRSEEKLLEQVFQNVIGIPARATLEGEHLNSTYGYIGAEQHLKRYPGDILGNHGEDYLREGIAPGLSAWGYLADSKGEMTPELEDIEKWYAVVQTLYLPDWNIRHTYLKDWYKYRKVIIINTDNGNAVVAAVADSGPAAWTGKQFGGSPEIMDALGGSKYKKGPVIVFFVDDPENKIQLGPVEYNNLDIAMLRN
jgi:hypothetical protein